MSSTAYELKVCNILQFSWVFALKIAGESSVVWCDNNCAEGWAEAMNADLKVNLCKVLVAVQFLVSTLTASSTLFDDSGTRFWFAPRWGWETLTVRVVCLHSNIYPAWIHFRVFPVELVNRLGEAFGRFPISSVSAFPSSHVELSSGEKLKQSTRCLHNASHQQWMFKGFKNKISVWAKH